MAIAVMEKAALIIPKAFEDEALRLLQEFGRIEFIKAADESGEFTIKQGFVGFDDDLAMITHAQQILAQFNKESAFKRLKNGRPVVSFSALEEAVSDSNWKLLCEEIITLSERLEAVRTRRKELIRLSDRWIKWKNIKFRYDEANRIFRYSKTFMGTVDSAVLDEFAERFYEITEGCGVCETVFSDDKQAGIILYFPEKLSSSVQRLFGELDLTRLDFEFDRLPIEELESWSAEEKAVVAEENSILDKLETLAQSKSKLDFAEDFIKNLEIRAEAGEGIEKTQTMLLISGWLEKIHCAEIEKLLESGLSCPYYLSFSAVSEEEISDVPIVLRNKKAIAPFETLTEMYSLPAYDEVDPTPAMTPFYLIFFGMMVADLGYGLVLLIATFLVKRFMKPDRELKRNIDFFFALSFPTMLWGLIYGSFFGLELPFVLLSTSKDIIPIMVISIALGWIQLVTGLVLSVYISWRRKDVLGAFSGGITWIALLLGLALIVVSKFVMANDYLFYAALGLSIIAMLGIVIFPVFENKKHKVKGFLKGLYALYGASGYIGDLVSYTRLMALGIAGGSIAVAFNTIIEALPFVARITIGVVLAIVLQGLNIFLSFLGAYVHGIRLQYVEFFGKFYGGGGRKFLPFKAAEKNIYIADK